jgi:alpha/beta superfamily hydrolase
MTASAASAQTNPHSTAALVRSLTLTGPAGRLEALLNDGTPGARFAALVCHPHPKGGGSMHNKVVYHAMKALNDPEWGLGWPVLRFNFRGTGLSQGHHDGRAEAGDLLAAIQWLENEFHLPLVVVGFSFGAMMTIGACCPPSTAPESVRALALLGLPLRNEGRHYQYPGLQSCTLPKLFLSGADDQYAPVPLLEQLAAAAHNPKLLVLLPRADHFFTGQLEPMQSALSGWLKEQLP